MSYGDVPFVMCRQQYPYRRGGPGVYLGVYLGVDLGVDLGKCVKYVANYLRLT